MRVTFTKSLADARLRAARETSKSQWPNVSYVTDVHPVLDWLTDKVLVEIGRHQAPVMAAAVEKPVFLIQGVCSNALGRPTIVKWMAVTGLADHPQVVELSPALLHQWGVGPQMPGRAVPRDLPGLAKLVPAAVDEARRYVTEGSGAYRQEVSTMLAPYRARIGTWHQEALFAAPRTSAKQAVDETAERLRHLVEALETVGEPMLRVLAVLEPSNDAAEGADR